MGRGEGSEEQAGGHRGGADVGAAGSRWKKWGAGGQKGMGKGQQGAGGGQWGAGRGSKGKAATPLGV